MTDQKLVYPCPLCDCRKVDVIEVVVINGQTNLLEAKCPSCKAHGRPRYDILYNRLPGMAWRKG